MKKLYPLWYTSAITKLGKEFNLPVEYDAETETFSIGRVTLTAPGGEDSDPTKNEWTIGVTSITHGVRYTKNGDGWPDEIDWSEDSRANFYASFRRAAQLLAEDLADGILESAEYDYYESGHNLPYSGSF